MTSKKSYKNLIFRIFTILIFLSFIQNCNSNNQKILGIWDCEVSLEDSVGIGLGLSYKMEFTKDKHWIPNLSESFQSDYEIRENMIISKSKIGISLHSTYSISIDGKKLDIETLGIKSYCIRESSK